MSQGQLPQSVIDDLVVQANGGVMPTEEPDTGWKEQLTAVRFTGKTVIVTGAASGIGRATASRIAREGGRVIAINLTGGFKVTRAVLPTMLQRGKGSIVNVSSEAGLRGNASGNAYTVSKHGVIGLTRSEAFMLGRKEFGSTPLHPAGWRPASRCPRARRRPARPVCGRSRPRSRPWQRPNNSPLPSPSCSPMTG